MYCNYRRDAMQRGFSIVKIFYAFSELTDGQLQCGRFEYSAGFPYIRGGNSLPHVPECTQFFSDGSKLRFILMGKLFIDDGRKINRFRATFLSTFIHCTALNYHPKYII